MLRSTKVCLPPGDANIAGAAQAREIQLVLEKQKEQQRQQHGEQLLGL